MDNDQLKENFWRELGLQAEWFSSAVLENSRDPLQPMQNQRDRTILCAATAPYHTDEDGHKTTTSSTVATKDSSSSSLLHNIPHQYGPGCVGVDPSVGYEDNEGHVRAGTGADGNVMFEGSEGVYANDYLPVHQGLAYTMTQSGETTANIFGPTASIDFPFDFKRGEFFTPSEIQYAVNMQSFNGEGLSARLSSSQELATCLTPSEDQLPALPTPTSIPRGLELYLDLPASHATDFCGEGDFDGSTSQQNYLIPAHSPGSSSASIGLHVSDPYGSQLPTPSPSADSHASLPLDSPAFSAACLDYTGMSQGLDYPETSVQLAAVPFVNDPYPYPQSVAYGPSQAGPSTLYFPTLQQTPPSAQSVVSRKRGTETRDTASLPAPAAKKKGGNGKGPGRIPKPRIFKCTVAGCDASYESKGTRNRHVKSHDRSKRLLCPDAQCMKPGEGGPSTFLDLHGLIRHVYNPNRDCRSKAPGLPAEQTQDNQETVKSMLLKLSEERKRKL